MQLTCADIIKLVAIIGCSFILHAFLSPTMIHASSSIDEEGSIDDLTVLSIVAAQQQGQANVITEDARIAAAHSGHPSPIETFNVQQSASSQLLHEARNPEETAQQEVNVETPHREVVAIMSGVDESAPEKRAVVIPGPASLEVVVEDVISESVIRPDIIAELRKIVPLPIETLAQVPYEAETGEFFVVTGKTIPTIQRLFTSSGELIDETNITNQPVLSTDDRGQKVLSGACGDAYYVVLLYKTAEQYNRDPGSFIMNRAFPCTGTFSYPVSDIPRSLPNGEYMLLFAEQGEVGDWVPITTLTEFILNR